MSDKKKRNPNDAPLGDGPADFVKRIINGRSGDINRAVEETQKKEKR